MILMTIRRRQELATLQRQVDTLGRSFQASPRTTPSSYQAPTTHATPANRDVPASPSPGQDDPRAEPPGHPSGLGTLSTIQPIRDERDNDQATRNLTKQESQSSLYNQPQEDASETKINEPIVHSEEIVDAKQDSIEHVEEDEVMEVEQPQMEFPAQNFENYEQNQPVTETEYQNPEYEQNYEQPAYTEEQYENYEQYPQQYTDPNAQYEADPSVQYPVDPNAQYENYAPDGNYETEQAYDTAQYNQEYQETPQYEEVQPEAIESKDTVPSQS